MSLATRCTACDTVFRVVDDQLKVSDGWVRCGRCSAVFNAREHLFDLDAAPGERSPDTPIAGAAVPSGWPAAEAGLAAPPAVAAAPEPDRIAPEQFDLADLGGTAAAGRSAPLDPAPAASIAADDSDAVRVTIGEPAATPAMPAVAADAGEAMPAPSFLRGDGPDTFWRRPAVRGTMAGLTVALSLALALQAALLWRDELASAQPGVRGALESICAALGCTISAPRRIDQLSIDASGLTRVDGSALHRLALTVRNRADVELLAPAVELTLTDVQGAVLMRRVLALAELGLAEPTLAAGREVPLNAVLSTEAAGRVHGYTVELFYP